MRWGNERQNVNSEANMRGGEPDRKRWTRMYKGVRFRRTPKQLGLPPDQWTEEGSYPAWMAWYWIAVFHFQNSGEVLGDLPPENTDWLDSPELMEKELYSALDGVQTCSQSDSEFRSWLTLIDAECEGKALAYQIGFVQRLSGQLLARRNEG